MKQPPLNVVAVVLLFVAILVALAVAFGHSRQRDALDDLVIRLDQIEQQQRLLAEHLLNGNPRTGASLAQSLGYSYRQAEIARSTLASVEDVAEQGPEAALHRATELHTRLESVYRAEPIDPGWAGTTMRALEDAIVNVAAEGAPLPETAQVDCRSSTCRIKLNLADRGETDQFMPSLLVKFAKTLPMTETVEIPSADGKSFDVYVYAMAEPPPS